MVYTQDKCIAPGMSYYCIPVNTAIVSNNWCASLTKIITNHKANNEEYDATVYVPASYMSSTLTLSSYAILQAINEQHVHIVETHLTVDDITAWQSLVIGWMVKHMAQIRYDHLKDDTELDMDRYFFYVMTDDILRDTRISIEAVLTALGFEVPARQFIGVAN